MKQKALIDTQVICMAASSSESFSKRVQALFDDPEADLFVSAASIVEIAIKFAIGKIELS